MIEGQELFDVTIIGGGSTGLYAAFYSRMRGLKTKVIEGSSELGGQITNFYAEKTIYDVGAHPKITGEALVEQLTEQATREKPAFFLKQAVESIEKQDDGYFILKTNDGTEHFSRTIIVAVGRGTYQAAPIPVEEATEYEGETVHFNISHINKFVGQKVLVYTNQRVGMDWALALEGLAAEIYLVNEHKAFTGVDEEDIQKLNTSSVDVRTFHRITGLNGSGGALEKVRLMDRESQHETEIEMDHILVYNGVKLNGAPFTDWGLETEKGKLVVNGWMETNVKGIVAAGDATTYSGKANLIASGFTEAITAVNTVAKQLNPKAPSQVYSTVLYR